MRDAIRRTCCTLLLFAASAAHAQDGYFSTAVIPIAVDSTSFRQEFTFDTVTEHGVTVHATFYPGDGTAQAATGPVACTDVTVQSFDGTTLPSLRDWCPGLVAGSVFGFVSLQAAPSTDDSYVNVPLFAVRSRVSNPAGAGFNVDAVAAATFGAGQTRVTGLRRQAAGADHPAYQSNCFIANLNQLAPGGIATAKRVTYRMAQALSGVLPLVAPPVFTGYVDVVPGQMVRMLDVFAYAGAPAGGYSDYMIDFTPTTSYSNRAGLMTFCTVQDNTSYQADLRLGKIFAGGQGLGAEEPTMARNQYWKEDVLHRGYAIPPGAAANTHLVYFRAPDRVKCELLSDDWSARGTSLALPQRLTPAAGLEIRMIDAAGLVLGGGSGMTSTGQVFLGERGTWTSARYDGRYLVEVESNGQNTAVTRAYTLYCTSGSGNTGGLDLVRYQEPVDRF
jgi:hypothetical protein